MDLAEFLLARVAEDEAWAKGVGNDFLRRHGPGLLIQEIDAFAYVGLNSEIGVSRRVLAECEAKRRIVALHDEPGHECIDRSAGVPIYPASDSMLVHGVPLSGCATLRLLALPYADHPDYNSEWKP